MADKEIVQLMIKIPKDLRERFKKIAMLNDTTMADVLREYIEEYIAPYEAPKAKPKRIRKLKKKAGDDIAENQEAKDKTE